MLAADRGGSPRGPPLGGVWVLGLKGECKLGVNGFKRDQGCGGDCIMEYGTNPPCVISPFRTETTSDGDSSM